MNSWGALIREAREAAGLTQAELADQIRSTPSVLSRIEAGKVFVEPHVYQNLISALRALKPVELLNALGYPVTVPSADRLPPQLIKDLLALEPRELEAVAFLVNRSAGRARLPQEPHR